MQGVIVVFIVAIFQISSSQEPSQNLATAFSFAKNLETAYQLAKSRSMPIMLISHMTSCPACKTLSPKLIASSELKNLSSNFVMVNNLDGQDVQADNIRPDKGRNYHPRIIFLDRNGRILTDICNPNQSNYKLYYATANEVADAMKKAIEVNKRS